MTRTSGEPNRRRRDGSIHTLMIWRMGVPPMSVSFFSLPWLKWRTLLATLLIMGYAALSALGYLLLRASWVDIVAMVGYFVAGGLLMVTGGPALATWLRQRLGEELGPEYATLLDVLSEAREELRAAGRSSEEPDWQSALDSGMLDLIRAGNVEEAKEILRACLWS